MLREVNYADEQIISDIQPLRRDQLIVSVSHWPQASERRTRSIGPCGGSISGLNSKGKIQTNVTVLNNLADRK
jgi:hypothetical protein